MPGVQIRGQDSQPALSFVVVLSRLCLGLAVALLFHELSELKKGERSCGSSARSAAGASSGALAQALPGGTLYECRHFRLRLSVRFFLRFALDLPHFLSPQEVHHHSHWFPQMASVEPTLGPQWSLLGHQEKGWGWWSAFNRKTLILLLLGIGRH